MKTGKMRDMIYGPTHLMLTTGIGVGTASFQRAFRTMALLCSALRKTRPAVTRKSSAQFLAGTYSNAVGSLDYKLFIPSGYRGRPLRYSQGDRVALWPSHVQHPPAIPQEVRVCGHHHRPCALYIVISHSPDASSWRRMYVLPSSPCTLKYRWSGASQRSRMAFTSMRRSPR